MFLTTLNDTHTKVEWLLSLPNTDPSARTHKGETALHLAAARSDEAMCKALLNGGCSANSVTREGKTALHVSSERGERQRLQVDESRAGIDSLCPGVRGSNVYLTRDCRVDSCFYSKFEKIGSGTYHRSYDTSTSIKKRFLLIITSTCTSLRTKKSLTDRIGPLRYYVLIGKSAVPRESYDRLCKFCS